MAETMDRRKFLAFAASGVALGALIAFHGCSDSSSTAPEPTPTYTDKNGNISLNHEHSITLTVAQQQAAADAKLTTTGGTHTHQVGLRATEVATIAAGTRFYVATSETLGHSHTVTFN